MSWKLHGEALSEGGGEQWSQVGNDINKAVRWQVSVRLAERRRAGGDGGQVARSHRGHLLGSN